MHAAAPGSKRALQAGHSCKAGGRPGAMRLETDEGGLVAAALAGGEAPLGSLVGASPVATAATGSRAGAARTAKICWQRGQRKLPAAPSGIFSSRLQCGQRV